MFSRNHIFAREDFFRLLDLEIKRARRYQNLFGVVRFELKEHGHGGIQNQGKNLRFMLKLLREEIRETDLLGQTEKNEVMILLPYCDSSGSEVVYARLDSLIKDFRFGKEKLKVSSGFVCFPMEGNDMTEILKKLQTRNINREASGTI